MSAQRDPAAIRDAATVIALRYDTGMPAVLMGQRGASAAFMPNKYVFPGGAVDPGDGEVPLTAPVPEPCRSRLGETSARSADALSAAAIRELWEETGQILGRPARWDDPQPGWRGFAATGHRPDASGLRFVFRAVTPPGRPRRFDARFFTVNASALSSDPDDFSRAEDELAHLHWVPIDQARALDLPFITEIVLGEVAAAVGREGPPPPPPFFRDDDERQLPHRLGGDSPFRPPERSQ